MLTKLLLLFILVPAAELFLLIELGRLIGTLPTLGIIIFTGVLGAYLARRQGLEVLRQMRAEMAAGQLPAGSIADGVIILLAGAVLMTPGVLTDTLGFLCLIPVTRRIIKQALWRRVEHAIRAGRIHVSTYGNMGRGPTIDIQGDPAPRDDKIIDL
jgi:UPF0716 protein FxsA